MRGRVLRQRPILRRSGRPASDAAQAVAAADAKSLHTLKDVGNKPLTQYILSEKIAAWHDVDEITPASDAADAAWFTKEA